MMKMTFSMIARKLFGIKYKQLKKALFMYLTVFWGLRTADFQITVTPFILYLMTSTFSAGVMWRALSSEDNASNMRNLFMLPFKRRSLIISYTAALCVYTLLTKTAGLWAVMLAVAARSGTEFSGCVLCAVNAVFMTACIYSQRKYWGPGILWTGAVLAAVRLLWNNTVFIPFIMGNCLLAVLLLSRTDAYSFCVPAVQNERTVKTTGRSSVWHYLFRYLTAHKNYLVNTAIMWGAACVFPAFLGRIETGFVMPVGFAVLSLNTPICILLSCNPALEQALRFLPGQKRAFCVPYFAFIFLCNMTADIIFLCSWQLQNGGVTGTAISAALFFALQSAAGSVLLEWFCPIRNWKIENDLWNHPRKYIVPSVMLLLAGAVSALPQITGVLLVLETAVLLFCWLRFNICARRV